MTKILILPRVAKLTRVILKSSVGLEKRNKGKIEEDQWLEKRQPQKLIGK